MENQVEILKFKDFLIFEDNNYNFSSHLNNNPDVQKGLIPAAQKRGPASWAALCCKVAQFKKHQLWNQMKLGPIFLVCL